MRGNPFRHCLLGIAAVGVLLVFGVQPGTLVYLAAVLACPLLMVFMMRGMMGGAAHGDRDHPGQQHVTGDGSTQSVEQPS